MIWAVCFISEEHVVESILNARPGRRKCRGLNDLVSPDSRFQGGLRTALLLCLLLGFSAGPAFAQSRGTDTKSGRLRQSHPAGKIAKADQKAEFTRDEASELLKVLLNDVPEISTGGIPGPLCVYGPRALPVVVESKGAHRMPFVAVADHGRGRLVAFAHGSFLGELPEQHAGTGQLVLNLIRWAGGPEPKGRSGSPKGAQAGSGGGFPIGVRGMDRLQKFLGQHQAQVVPLTDKDWTNRLRLCRVVIAPLEDCTPEQIRKLEQYVYDGGAVISAALVWGWLQSHPSASPPVDHPANRLFSKAGIVWADGYAETHSGAKVAVSANPVEFAQVGWALSALEQSGKKERTLEPGDYREIDAVLATAYAAIPRQHDSGILERIDGLLANDASAVPIPSDKAPVSAARPQERLLVSLQTRYFNALPVENLKPHPGAGAFPGDVDRNSDGKAQTVKLSLDQAGWKSTGLYAPPGEKIVVQVKPGELRPGLTIQIGAHSDGLWHLDSWKRPPEVVRRFAWDKPRMEIGSAFGGLIFIDVPEKSADGTLAPTISNAVPAPWFRLGKDTNDEWSNELKLRPAPWAELECRNLILTVPSRLIRELDDPTALMEHWVQVVDACADLATIPRDRKVPQRMVFDVQISAGYLHSGYPIMGHIDPTGAEVVNLRHLHTEGGWGFYHELGHNHQVGEWTFDGTVEVTCNLFALYVLEKLTPKAFTHPAMQPAERDKRERLYIEQGARFEQWKSDPFLALTMYQQLQTGFGWQPFKDVFAEYRALQEKDRPKTDDEKREQWMVRFSRHVGRNLAPFFQYWGVPTSDGARSSIRALPTWMPEGRPFAR